MKISFFEEFPTKENIEKIKLIKFKTNIYLASKSLEEFTLLKKKLKKNKYVEKVIYWPILEKKDGYWLSPWTNRKAILRVINEVKEKKFELLWDAEYPSICKRLLIKNTINFQFIGNMFLIKKFFKEYGKKIYTAEYFFQKGFLKYFLKCLCLSFNPLVYGNKVIKMCYSSLHSYEKDFMKREMRKYVEKYKEKFIAGLGVIAKGISGKEPILKPKELKIDLKICKDCGVNEVIIYRLGGLNKKYLNVINNFIQ